MDLTAKRTRQARRLLRVCVRELEDGCLAEYVEAFEAGTLEHGHPSFCAVGTMGRGCGKRYGLMLGGLHARAVRHIESVFEGVYMDRYGSFLRCWGVLSAPIRRLLIYEACVETLAERAVERAPRGVPVEA